MNYISTTAQKKETKQHLLSLPDNNSKNAVNPQLDINFLFTQPLKISL